VRTIAAMAAPTSREIVDEYIRAMVAKDFDTQVALLADDFVEEMPQSGERTRGSANFRAIAENYPGGVGTIDPKTGQVIGAEDRWVMGPSFNVLRVEGSGDTFTYAGTLTYAGGDVWHVIAILKLRDGKIARITSWYAEPFEAPEWRGPYVERFEPPHG
jgi:ketosteroid isomerase-like protein